MVYFVNNNFVNEEDASLHVSDLSIQRGYALFDFLRTKDNVPLFIDDYLDRFYNSSKLLGLKPQQDREQLKSIIGELINLNGTPDSGLKIILTGGYSHDGYAQAAPNLIVTHSPLQMPPDDVIQKAAKVITHDYLRTLPSIKSTNYLMGVWLQPKLKESNADDVLYYSNNLITELPRANFFIVNQHNILLTPKENILCGITRKKVLELARLKYDVEERPVTLQEVHNAKEAFITSSTKRIQPVIQVDQTIINDGKTGQVTQDLFDSFIKLENKYLHENLNQVHLTRTS